MSLPTLVDLDFRARLLAGETALLAQAKWMADNQSVATTDRSRFREFTAAVRLADELASRHDGDNPADRMAREEAIQLKCYSLGSILMLGEILKEAPEDPEDTEE